MNVPTVAQDWAEFAEHCLRGGAPDDLLRARLIFYAGYRCAMNTVAILPDVDKERGTVILADIYEELTAFEERIKRSTARQL